MSVKFNPFTGQLDLVGGASSIDVSPVKYFGDPDTDGSWREIVVGTDLQRQRREGGVWVEKAADLP